jgi:hypothetical protein
MDRGRRGIEQRRINAIGLEQRQDLPMSQSRGVSS